MATAPIDSIIGNEDITFHIASFLCPRRNPSSLTEFYSNECFVSKLWNNAFGLVRAQLRWDFLRKQLSQDEDNGWLYHKLIYIPKGSVVPNGGGENKLIPHEGMIRIFRSHVNDTCFQSLKDFQSSRQNDPHGEHIRADSRPDYYYRTYQETAEYLDLIPPRTLHRTYNTAIIIQNNIEYDEKPRLVNEFVAFLDDVTGCSGSLAQEKSSEGRWNLGYHEIVNVRDSTFSRIHPRPPHKGHGTDTTSFLSVLKAKPSILEGPRRVKFAHLRGEDECRKFIKKHLLPIIGSRPSGTDHLPSS
eukprot:scaffold10826_cov136-Skeletonema_menzelii.AAC.3